MGNSSSSHQQVAVAIAPKVGGAISILGSLWIFLEILGSREKRQQVYHRMMFMMSMFDTIVSSGAFSSTWPMTTDDQDPWRGRGTDTTCSIQGFSLQLGATLFTYNAALSIFYVLLITFKVTEQRIHKRYEWALHGLPLCFGIGTATTAAAKNWYHNANLWCWIAVDPVCIDYTQEDDLDEYCDRFQHIWIYRWALFFAPLWLCFLVQFIALIAVARSVYKQEAKVDKYLQPHKQFAVPAQSNELAVVDATTGPPKHNAMDDNDDSPEEKNGKPSASTSSDDPEVIAEESFHRGEQLRRALTSRWSSSDNLDSARKQEFSRTKQVGVQCILYICAFYMTYFFATLNRILQQVRGSSPFAVLLLHSLTLPYQGFWNFLIYRRPCYLQLRRQNHTRWKAILASLELSWFRENPATSRTSRSSQKSSRQQRTSRGRAMAISDSSNHLSQLLSSRALEPAEQPTDMEASSYPTHTVINTEGNTTPTDMECPTHDSIQTEGNATPTHRHVHRVTFSDIPTIALDEAAQGEASEPTHKRDGSLSSILRNSLVEEKTHTDMAND